MGIEGVKERLEGFAATLPGGIPPEEGTQPEGTPQAGPEVPAEQMAAQALSYLDKACSDNGLTPLNEVQRFILNVGLIGCIRKYNVSLGMLEKYPEAALVVGGSWVALEKVKEFRTKQAAAAMAEAIKEKIEEAAA